MKSYRILAIFTALAVLVIAPLCKADLIKQSSAYNRTVLLVSSSDHVSGLTGQSGTITVIVSKNGGAEATITPTITELGHGKYNLALTTTHTNTLGAFDIYVTATGSDPADFHDQIVAFDPSSATNLGLSALPTASAGALNGLPLGDASGRVALQPMDSLVTQSGTVQAGAASTVTLAAGASATDSLYVGSLIKIYSGTGVGQVRLITAYNGTTKVATIGTAWTTQPMNGDSYAVLYFRAPLIDASGYVTVGSNTDKTGYSLSGTQTFSNTGTWTGNLSGSIGSVTSGVTLAAGQNVATLGGLAPPSNFNLFSLDASGRVLLQPTQTGVTIPTVTSVSGNVGGSVNSVVTAVTAGTVQDKTGYSLVQTFPTNFANLLINAGTGGVTLNNNLDKTGYNLTQAFPANFSSFSLDTSGRVTSTPAEHALYAGDVFNATASSYNAAGSLGQKLNSAASAGDPLSNAVPGGYAAGTAGYVLGHKIPSTLAASDVTGNLPSIVNAYVSGQDPATLVLAAVVDGSLTVKQEKALSIAVLTGKFTIVRDSTAKTITVTYKRADGITNLAVMVTNYSDTALTLSTNRTVTYFNLP